MRPAKLCYRMSIASNDNGTIHIKKEHSALLGCSELKYAFIKDHRNIFEVSLICKLFSLS